MEEHVLIARGKNETWTVYEQRKDKQPCKQDIKDKDIEDSKKSQGVNSKDWEFHESAEGDEQSD